ncbi:molecular chaperone MKKS [Ambystoma mexicanum]|uniref:molecular chaperone MKKS n=1 Tax=Ambystoma mexicanum TaxID=8296 RepID=UPI0037E8D9D9
MSRADVKKPSICRSGRLNTEIFNTSLCLLSEIVMSCYGPSGRLKQLHNSMGGSVLTTSQSSTLLNVLPASHPGLKVLIASVLNHTSRFSDCGLFAAILCCSLVKHVQKTNLPSGTVISINTHLLRWCTDYLNAEECSCRLKVDYDSSKTLLCLARTAITSKPTNMLTIKEADYVSTLVLKAFLLTVPNELGPSAVLGRVVIVPVEGQRVMESGVFPGLLIEMTEFQLDGMLPMNNFSGNCVKTALFCISLSGDLSDIGGETLLVQSGVSPEAALLGQLISLGKHIIHEQVDLVLCQKVIHPSLKQYLKANHVMAVERLGAALMEPLTQMTGAQPIGSLYAVPSTCFGRLKRISVERLASKQFLHLISEDATICSLLLCNRNGTTLDELKRACYTAQHVLQLTIRHPVALFGGGCTETHLASYLRFKCINVPNTILEELNCSRTQYQMVAELFCQSLESVARCLEHDGGELLIDMCKGHLWSSPPGTPLNSKHSETVFQCGCGLYKKQPCHTWSILGSRCCPFDPQNCSQEIDFNPRDHLVLDCFAAKISSLQVAVETANLILDLSYIIEDQN